MALDVMWPLTVAWYADRLAPDYRPKPLDEVQQMLTDAGLTSPFWRFADD